MSRKLLLSLAVLFAAVAAFALQPQFATDPAVSPDGKQVCFVYDNDLWIVPYYGGDARRLTTTYLDEWGPSWSPDGNWIAFNSNREGSSYPYLISPRTGEVKLVFAESFVISDWFADGQSLLCTKYNQTFGSSFYQVPLDGTRPVLLAEIGDRYATLSPDNTSLIFNRNGYPHREAYTGSQAGDLWQIDLATKAYTQLTDTPYTERYPRFSYTTSSKFRNYLYYCASDGQRYQIFRARGLDFADPEQMTQLTDWSARDISIARKNDNLAFEYFNEIWTCDDRGKVGRLNINLNEDLWIPDVSKKVMQDNFDEFTVSPDGMVVAFQFGYDTFLMPAQGGEAKRVTNDQASQGAMEFLDDSRTVVFTQLEQGRHQLYTVKCDSLMTVKPLDWFGRDSLDVENIVKDPSGKWVIYYGDNRVSSRIAIGSEDLTDIRPLEVSRPVVSNFAINSTGDYAVYAVTREDVWVRELWLYDFTAGTSRKIMNDDAWISSLAWTPDNKSILMSRSGDIYRLDLVPRDELEYDVDNWAAIYASVPSDTEDEDSEPEDTIVEDGTELDVEAGSDTISVISEEEPEPEPEPLQIVWPGIEKRLFKILSDDEMSLSVQYVITDSTFYYLAETDKADTSNILRKANIYGKNVSDEFDLGEGSTNHRWVGPVLYFTLEGVIFSCDTDFGSVDEIHASFDYSYSVKKLNTRLFEQVWGVFGLNFYDPNMHGQNWQRLYDLYHPYAENARSIYDITAIVNEMIGDVNASHTGFYPRDDFERPYKLIAQLGAEFSYTDRLAAGIGLKTVYPTSRLGSFYGLAAGDVITHIDGVAIMASTPVDSLLADKVGKKIKLRFLKNGVSGEAVVIGLSGADNRKLYYDYKVAQSKALVDEMSGGRIGYIHIPAMGSKDYENFQREVFRDNADKEALIIDVRGNSGGHVHDQIISLLNKKPYAYSTSRRYTGERQLEPRRGWMKPTILLVDEGSFSDGEIFPTVYQELKLGKVVGVPSSGSVIGTWEYDLLDGSSMRLPGSGWYRLDGTNMEGNGVVPDIIVPLSPEDEISCHDSQLLRALEELDKDLQ